jgi:hypothetical protein
MNRNRHTNRRNCRQIREMQRLTMHCNGNEGKNVVKEQHIAHGKQVSSLSGSNNYLSYDFNNSFTAITIHNN